MHEKSYEKTAPLHKLNKDNVDNDYEDSEGTLMKIEEPQISQSDINKEIAKLPRLILTSTVEV